MPESSLHESAFVVDGLIISNFNPEIFECMLAGGITAANCTCSIWENFRQTMDYIAQWKSWFHEHPKVIRQVYCVQDIAKAKQEKRVGVILGWQNTSAIEDRLDYLQVFHELGVRVVQLTYNTQNLVGSGCYESNDSGLSDFGRQVVKEMNRLGMVIDLSHVGAKTSADTIELSSAPVCYTHIAPAALKAHPRNKTDEQMRMLVANGGFIGVTLYPPFMPKGSDSTLADYVLAIEHVLGVAGEDRVGIGTDFAQRSGHRPSYWRDHPGYFTHDKGYSRRLVDLSQSTLPKDFQTLADYGNLTRAMETRGWNGALIRKVLGENWMNYLQSVWH
jgi:membrane dipeptidase